MFCSLGDRLKLTVVHIVGGVGVDGGGAGVGG